MIIWVTLHIRCSREGFVIFSKLRKEMIKCEEIIKPHTRRLIVFTEVNYYGGDYLLIMSISRSEWREGGREGNINV